MVRPSTWLSLAAVSINRSIALQIPFLPASHSEGYKFDALLHLPGISPYFDAIGSGLNHKAPRGCEVIAASYLVRHAAIYANDADYEQYIEPFLKKLNSTYTSTTIKKRQGWTGSLSFFSKWKNPIDNPKKQLEQITPQGIKDCKKVGKHLLSRYPELVPTTKTIYADKKSRTQDTAEAFVKAFPQDVKVEVLRSNRTSYHAQDPHKACDAFSKKPGDKEMDTFMAKYSLPVIERLQPYSPVSLDQDDIMGMQQLCGYESAINGKKSAICDVFTDSEWMAYEFAWDMKYYHMVGHGNPLSPYLGFPWLNTTSNLFSKFHSPKQSPTKPKSKSASRSESSLAAKNLAEDNDEHDNGQRFFLSFTHREVPPFIATALGLFNSSSMQDEQFPTDQINWSRSWRMAELVPFLGHVGIEKLTCVDGSGGLGPTTSDHKRRAIEEEEGEGEEYKEYVRIIANTAPRPIPACQDGPGASCGFEAFAELVRKGMETYGDFDKACNNSKSNVEETRDEL